MTPGTTGTTGTGLRAGALRLPGEPFRSLKDSKHAYYRVFDFEIEVTHQFGS